ncbi:MAG: alanine racemase, partial [candidate division Zixibacteria bacterium]|nr:alanine racemase [candidate division Zixibacteria bacterium]
CLIEVNTSGEQQKFGVTPDDCLDLVGKVAALNWIELTGLMTIGPYTDDEDRIRGAFALCRDLYRRGRDTVGDNFDTLSMGMTDDFPLAIAEGSTMIRVGTLLFGERQLWRESQA